MMPEHVSSVNEHLDPAPGQEGRVLVVEDNPSVRCSMADILRAQGLSVAEATDGAAATWLLADETFDAVVLDLRLPHVDGTVVLEALEPKAPVVIVSAFSYFDEDTVRGEFGSTVFACLRKPVAPQRLIEVVTAAAAAGGCPRVRPIGPRDALRLGLASLARVGTPSHEAVSASYPR